MPGVAQRTLVALIVGALLLGGRIGAVVTSVLDADNTTTAGSAGVPTTTTPPAPATTVPAPAPVTTPAGPPCTSSAILQAIQQSGINAVSVAGVQCGNGWAGASYETAQIAGASLLKAHGSQWVVTDRGQSCNDPSIPPAVHLYCTVS
jgi:hypothetical protein